MATKFIRSNVEARKTLFLKQLIAGEFVNTGNEPTDYDLVEYIGSDDKHGSFFIAKDKNWDTFDLYIGVPGVEFDE